MLRYHLIALATLLTPSVLIAQSADSPIKHSLYVALGGDPGFGRQDRRSALALSAGVERGRAGSRWSLQLGADYRRETSTYSDTRFEVFGIGATARYGRRSGAIRPYLLGGIGIADLRRRGRWLKYDDVNTTFYGPLDLELTSSSRWNGSISSGLGADVTLGPLRVFTEARLNLYPERLSDRAPHRALEETKALYFGLKF